MMETAATMRVFSAILTDWVSLWKRAELRTYCILALLLSALLYSRAAPVDELPYSKQKSVGIRAEYLRSGSAQSPRKTQSEPIQVSAEKLRSSALILIRNATRQDLAKAVMQLKEAARLMRAIGFLTDAARDYLTIGEIYLIWSRKQQARSMYILSLHLIKKSDRAFRCSALSHIANLYATFGDQKRARRYADRAMAVAAQVRDVHVQAEASEALGEALAYSDDAQKAVDHLNSAAAGFERTADIDGQGRAHLNAGFAYVHLGSLWLALAEEEKALALWISIENLHGTAQARAALGLLWATLGEPDRALAEYQEAQRIFHRAGDLDHEAIILEGLGSASKEIGAYEDSLRYYQDARHNFTLLGDEAGIDAAINGAAQVKSLLHSYRGAEALYRTKLRRGRQAGNVHIEASALMDLGSFYEWSGSHDRALAAYLRAKALLPVSDSLGKTEVQLRLGHLLAETERYYDAIAALDNARQLAQNTGRLANLARANFELASVHRSLKQLDHAQQEAENAIQIIESQRVKVSDFGSRATYFASVHDYYQLYIDILMQLHEQHPEQNYVAQALEASEKSKVRSLLDMLATSATTAKCSPGATDQPAPSADCIVAPAALATQQVQALIQDVDTILLEYALGDHASYLWAVQQGSISSYRLPGSARMLELAKRFRSAVLARQGIPGESAERFTERVSRADKIIHSAAQELSQTLLRPVAGLLSAKQRILVVPDGPLQYIPFAALPLPSAEQDRQTLADRYEVTSLPSASTLEALRDAAGRRPAPTGGAAVFADPVFSADDIRFSQRLVANVPHQPLSPLGTAMRDVQFGSGRVPRLPASLKEAEEIANIFPADRVLLAIGFDASRNTVLSADLQRYRYIHFATHGILDSIHPEFSGLILSLVDRKGNPEDGYLRLRDIYNLKLSADLVVLSSCNSALGKDLQSEGIIGITRAFLYAGSQRVISTLWKVDDEATAKLMHYFYSRLHAGEDPASALRGAQSDLKEEPRWQNPYYWAAFILQGEYR